MVRLRSLFFKPKHPEIARQISIRTPNAFHASIRRLRKGGYTLTKYRALLLARTRAQVMLKRQNLSGRERAQMQKISMMPIPKPAYLMHPAFLKRKVV